MSLQWDTKKVIAVAVLVGAVTQIGNGLKAASWLIGVPEAAYGGQAVAQKVDEEFKQYLTVQKASTEAIQSYIANQQQQAVTLNDPMTEEISDDGEVKEMRWTDERGVRRHMCCTGSECWPWSRKTQCVR